MMLRILISVFVLLAVFCGALSSFGEEALPGDRTARFYRKEAGNWRLDWESVRASPDLRVGGTASGRALTYGKF